MIEFQYSWVKNFFGSQKRSNHWIEQNSRHTCIKYHDAGVELGLRIPETERISKVGVHYLLIIPIISRENFLGFICWGLCFFKVK